MDFAADSRLFLADSPHRAVVGFESVPVLYDAPFRQAEVHEGQVETSAPACTMADSDVAALVVIHGTRLSILKGDALVGDFEVIGKEPDDMGLTRLILTKDP